MSARRVLVENNAALPLIHFSVSRRTGSSEDPIGKEGATRLLARLMRRTGGGRTADELDTELDCMGATLGAEVSTSTAGVSGTVISRNFDSFLSLIEDIIAHPSLDEAEFERLKRETNAELIDVLDNDRALARRWFRRTLFEGHSYGRAVTGTRESLERIQRQDMASQWNQCWVQGNLVFSFAGDIGEDAAKRAAERLSAAMPDGEGRPDNTPEPHIAPGRHLVIVDKPERTQTQILIGTLGTSAHDEDHTALTVANTVFGGTFTARLSQEVRAKRGWSYGAYSSAPYDRHRHAFSMWTFPKASEAADCIALELELLETWVKHGISEEELGWATAYLINSHAFTVDTAAKRVGLKLDEELYSLPDGYFDSFVDRVRAVTREQANEAVRRRISTKDLLVTVVGTNSLIGESVRGAVPDLADTRVVSFDAL